MVYNIAPEYVSFLMAGIILVYSGKNPGIPDLKNKLFRFAMYVTFFTNLISIISVHTKIHYQQIPMIIVHLFNISEFIFNPLMALSFAYYIMAVIWENHPKLAFILKTVSIPFVIYSLAVLTTPVTHFAYYFQAPQGYTIGQGYLLIYALPAFYIVLMIGLVLFNGKKLERTLRMILLYFPVIAILLVAIQFVYPELVLSGAAAVSALLVVSLYLQNKKITEDDLTGLQNRKAFSQMLNLIFSQRLKTDIFLISLDDFKVVNDKFGYAYGDMILKEISAYLQTILPLKAIYRFGGDEFAFILEDKYRLDGGSVIKKIERRFKSPWVASNLSYLLTVSIAELKIPESDTKTVEDVFGLLEHSISISKSKDAARGKVVIADSRMLEQIHRRNRIYDILKNAIANDSLEVYFQPVYSIRENKFVSAEALSRLSDKELGTISPAEFIPIAEKTGMIIELGYLVLDKVCRFIRNLEREGRKIDVVSLNFSSFQMFQENMTEKVMAVIKRNGVDTRKIRIEITESVLVDKFDDVKDLMKNLIERGVEFYIDDFGTGYSNLSIAIRLPFQAIKLDKSLLYEAMVSEDALVALQALTKAFSEIGRKVIIEGVETDKQREMLEKVNCHEIQGYLYAKPMPASNAMSFFPAGTAPV